MWGITDLLIVGVGLLITAAVLLMFVRAFWPERAEYDETGDGINLAAMKRLRMDAAKADADNVVHMTRRANHERRKA